VFGQTHSFTPLVELMLFFVSQLDRSNRQIVFSFGTAKHRN